MERCLAVSTPVALGPGDGDGHEPEANTSEPDSFQNAPTSMDRNLKERGRKAHGVACKPNFR